ncbi:MAG: Gmad2 immunoglobulin-like domain-containing protein [Bacillota bacterium]
MKRTTRFPLVLAAVFCLLVASCGCRATPRETPPAPREERPQEMRVAVYYVKMTEQDAYLVREVHTVPYMREVARAALEELIRGTPETPGAFRVLPHDTKIRSVKIADGLATVDFSREVLRANVGAAAEGLGIQSIVNSLTEFPTVSRVRFLVEGGLDERAKEWWGHMGLYGQPFTRNLDRVIEPAIWVTRPQPEAVVTSPLEVRGSAMVFEGTVYLRLVTAEGKKLAETYTTATAGAPARGEFAATLTFTPPRRGKGFVEVFWPSPKDGSELDMVRVPVQFAAP